MENWKLHLLQQFCGRRANRRSKKLGSLKVFALQRLTDICGLLIYLKVKNEIVKMVVFYFLNFVDIQSTVD